MKKNVPIYQYYYKVPIIDIYHIIWIDIMYNIDQTLQYVFVCYLLMHFFIFSYVL